MVVSCNSGQNSFSTLVDSCKSEETLIGDDFIGFGNAQDNDVKIECPDILPKVS